jgi:hypothetical protein
MDYNVKRITPKDLLAQHENRENSKKSVKNMILSRCYHRIRYYNSVGEKWCLFEIPPLMIGLPPYNQKEMIDFIYASLDEAGFYVINVLPMSSIYISWKKEDLQKMQKEKDGYLVLDKNGFLDNLPINPKALGK